MFSSGLCISTKDYYYVIKLLLYVVQTANRDELCAQYKSLQILSVLRQLCGISRGRGACSLFFVGEEAHERANSLTLGLKIFAKHNVQNSFRTLSASFCDVQQNISFE